MPKSDGGSAFPRQDVWPEWSERACDYETKSAPVGGMSLRDYFAAKALNELLGYRLRPLAYDCGFVGPYLDQVAVNAYAMADAMLKEREK